jgi:hypothetical protein
MSFLHLWAIGIGVAALAAPLAIHWLTRPRPQRMPLSTLRFVRDAIRQRRAAHLLRDILILSLRTLAVAMLALAVAQPIFETPSAETIRAPGDTVRVVLVDVSQSMAVAAGATQQIAAARALAANQYLQYEPGLTANVILAGASPRAVFDGPSTNFEMLRDELSRCQALPERLDVKAALDRAGQMLAPRTEQDKRRRELVIFSDFQRSNWAKADFSVLPPDAIVKLESTAPKEPPGNLAVVRAAAHADGARAGNLHLEVEVLNDTPQARKMAVDVTLGEMHRRLEGTCAARNRLTLSEEIEVAATGWLWGEARLVGAEDALDADNVRPLVVQLRAKPTYAIVTRQSPRQRPSSSYFLECALVPDSQLGPKASANVVRIDPAGVDARSLAKADLVCLDHPGKLTDDAIKVVAAGLRRGQAVLYVAGETIDATNLNRLAAAAGTGLHMPVEFTPPPAGSLRRNLFLKRVRSEELPFSAFGDSLASLIASSHFAAGLSSRPLPGGLAEDVLATYSDGTACLIATTSGAGALVVLNADTAGSELPGKSMFVLLAQSLVDRMLNRGGEAAHAFCGERLVAHLPQETPSAKGLQFMGPETATAEPPGGRYGELYDEGAGVVWDWRVPQRAGVYRVCREGNTVFAQAIEIPSEESKLEYLSPDVLRNRLAAGRQVYYRSALDEEERRDDLWKWCAAVCAICVLGELTSLIAFRT